EQRPAEPHQPITVLDRRASQTLRAEERDHDGPAATVEGLHAVDCSARWGGIQRTRLCDRRQRLVLWSAARAVESDVIVDTHAAGEKADTLHHAAQALAIRAVRGRDAPLHLCRVRQQRLEGAGVVARGQLPRGGWRLGYACQQHPLLAVEREQ